MQENANECSDLQRSLYERYFAIAKAYNCHNEEKYFNYVMKDCENAMWKKAIGKSRPYHAFRPHVQCGLEYGVIAGEPRDWLDNSSKHRFRFLSNLKTFSARKDFQSKYCERLKEVTRTLDLDVEDLQEKSEVIFDENGFSSTFYDGFIPEFCGTSIESVNNKNTIKSRHKGVLDISYDPINIVRTYYIMREIFEIDLDLDLNLTKIVGRISAIDLILTLNVIYDLTDENLEKDVRKRKVLAAAASHFDSKIVDSLIIWQLSLPQCFNLLQKIGFSEQEVDKLFFDKAGLHLLSDLCCRVLDYDNIESLIDIMKKRKHLISLEGVKLGIGDISDTYHFLMNWDKVTTALDEANIGENPCFVKFGQKTITIGTLPYCRATTSAARTFLVQYFGYDTRDQKKAFDKLFKKVPHAKDVPLKIVIESVQYLEDMNFSFEQIEKGFPIVFYDKEILEQKIEAATNAMGESWMEKENALSTLNYFIEVETNFSFAQIYTGILKNFQRGLSLQQFHDLKGSDSARNLDKRVR